MADNDKIEIGLNNILPYQVQALHSIDKRTKTLEDNVASMFQLLLKIHGKKRVITQGTKPKKKNMAKKKPAKKKKR